jgi:hypothetical protein
VLDADGDAVLREHVVLHHRIGLVLRLPPLQRLDHVRAHVPVARVVSLVLVEVHTSALEIDVAPAQRGHLIGPHAFPSEKAVGQAAQHRNVGFGRFGGCAGEQGRILVGVEALLGLLVADPRQPPSRDRRRLDPLARVHREVHQARHHLCNVTARAGRELAREVRHHELGIREGELIEANVLHMRQHVEPQELLVAVGGALLLHVVRMLPSEVPAGPLLGPIGERWGRRRLRSGLPSAESLYGIADGLPRSPGAGPSAHLQELLDLRNVPSTAKTHGHRGESRAALLGVGLAAAGRQDEVAPVTALDGDSRRVPVG